MINSYIQPILVITGLITASMFFQFAAPRQALRAFAGLDIDNDTSLFFARTGALSVGLFGVLLIWAGLDPAIRTPIIAVSIIGKAGFVAAILSRSREFYTGYALTIVFDLICVALYSGYLAGL